jgi:hypothetical protein
MCAISPIAPDAVKAAKAREWPTAPISLGAHQQPTKKPRKCAEPKRPICPVVKPSSVPDSTSSGPTPPEESCSRTTDRNRAAKETRRRMGPGFGSRELGTGFGGRDLGTGLGFTRG